jgi:hypothetical protein
MTFDPITIIIILVALVALWFVFRLVLSLTAAVFRVGCFVLFLAAVAAGIIYIL